MMHTTIASRVMEDTPSKDVASLVYSLIFNEEGDFGDSYSIAFLSPDGGFETGVVFNNYIPEYKRIEVHIASLKKNWLTFGKLLAIMKVPLRLGCEVVISRTDPSNYNAIQLMERCGAKSYLLPNVRGEGKDEIYQVMLMSDMKLAKFWRKAYGR
jgi:hypothetical protein